MHYILRSVMVLQTHTQLEHLSLKGPKRTAVQEHTPQIEASFLKSLKKNVSTKHLKKNHKLITIII